VPSSGRSPPSRGASVAGAAQVVGPQDTIKAQPSDGAAGGDRVLVSYAAGAAAQAAIDSGSPAPEVLLEGDTNVTVEEVAACDLAVLSEVILGHPTVRAPGDVSLDEAMGIAHWALTQA
jgi:hypothetical protein